MSRRELKGKQVRTMLSTEYIKSDINNIEDKIKNKGRRLPAKAVTPMAQGCHHELTLQISYIKTKSQHSKKS